MNYTFHQLQIFLKVCEYQSITKAAEALFLTQPAVSIQLKKLQDEFKIPLTEVIGRQLFVTDFGKEIKKLAEDILLTSAAMEVKKLEYEGILTGNIRIASASTGKYVIPYFLTEFMLKHPQVNISIDVTNKTQVVKNLQDNSIDFALVSVMPPHLSLERLPLIQNELYLVSSVNYAGIGTQINLKSLEKYTLIFREEGSATRIAMQTYLNDAKIVTRKSMELTSNEAVKQAVKAGLGISIVPIIGIQNELQLNQMKIIKIKGLPIVSRWNLAYSKGKRLAPAEKALLKYIEENKKSISQKHFSMGAV
jgi:DNA-binding transcriptional LysR family regulator